MNEITPSPDAAANAAANAALTSALTSATEAAQIAAAETAMYSPFTKSLPTFTAPLGGKIQLCVAARALHQQLQMKRCYSDWVKDNFSQLIEDQDFRLHHANVVQSNVRGGHNRKDYILTIEAAKMLAMSSRSENATQVRRYFAQVEERYFSQQPPAVPAIDATAIATIMSAALQPFAQALSSVAANQQQQGELINLLATKILREPAATPPSADQPPAAPAPGGLLSFPQNTLAKLVKKRIQQLGSAYRLSVLSGIDQGSLGRFSAGYSRTIRAATWERLRPHLEPVMRPGDSPVPAKTHQALFVPESPQPPPAPAAPVPQQPSLFDWSAALSSAPDDELLAAAARRLSPPRDLPPRDLPLPTTKHVNQFLAECVERTQRSTDLVRKGDLFRRWSDWAIKQGVSPGSIQVLGRYLGALGTASVRPGKGRVRCWAAIRLRQ